jgi:multidrug efflux pump subunit AcrA (membrane-fusion protein)
LSGDADIILREKRNVLKIPLSAVINTDMVYVQNNKTFEKRQVTLGLKNDTDVEIIDGLNLGDVIAIQPDQVQITK